MTEKCYDDGAIQAFLDGELDADTLETIACHTAACDDCARLLHEAETESAFAFSALGEEFNSLVPTERIRTNLYGAIRQIEEPRRSFLHRIFGANFNFSNPSIVAFAGLFLVFGIFTTLLVRRESQTENVQTAKYEAPKIGSEKTTVAAEKLERTDEFSSQAAQVSTSASTKNGKTFSPAYKIEPAANRPKAESAFNKTSFKTSNRAAKTEIKNLAAEQPETKGGELPGEANYVRTIATLSGGIDSGKNAARPASEQVAFARDLAMIDDAITKMREEVRRNPKNEAAKQVLRSSYQNKIDLLNAAAEKNELMASLK